MYLIIIALLAFIVVFTIGMYTISVVTSKFVTRTIQARLRALEQLTNEQVPDDWLRPFQRRVMTLHRASADDARLAQLGQKLQKRCLRRLEEMIRYTTNINLTDSKETQQEIVTILKAQQAVWESRKGREWITHVEALDDSNTLVETQENDLNV